MNKKARILSLFLALVLSLGALASCSGDGGGNIQTGDRVNGSWDDVDFKGSELVVSLSANNPEESNMGTSILYTKGPDKASTDKVQQKAYERNRRVAEMLNISVNYKTTDDALKEAYDAIEKQMNNPTPPDVYSDDIYALLRAMFQGYLKNVLDFGTNKDGTPVQNFFDFTYDGWYQDYMKGVTLDADKQYLLAGDYFIDLVRFAWVLFVNVDQFNEAFAKELDWKSYDEAAGRIDYNSDNWTYDDLIYLSGKAHMDTTNKGTTDVADERIGLLLNRVSERISLYTSGLSIVEWKGEGGESVEQAKGTPVIVGRQGTDPATKSLLSDVATAYKALYRAEGVYNTGVTSGLNGNKEATDLFVNASAIFSTMLLGEMESKALREVSFNRGVLPFPKYDTDQESFHTLVHDTAEIGCVLINAKSPTMASAFMQAINEDSKDVLHEYYENSLKVKYNTAGEESESGVRLMIDLVYESIDSPFESLIVNYFCLNIDNEQYGYSVYTYMRHDARDNTTNFSAKYDEAVNALQTELDKLVETFNNLK
ncbi:MAG: hypothetical protein J6K61_00360 [Clostridia bacterium]|nr:hypothetical protein [Clostridia bacterium]